jgi:hypothetical protein
MIKIILLVLLGCKLPEISEKEADKYEATWYLLCDTVSCQDADNVLYQDGIIHCTWNCVYTEDQPGLVRLDLEFYQNQSTGCWEQWTTYVGHDSCAW